jgi:hypothetical protein
VHGRLGFLDWGFRRRTTRGMSDMGRKYLVPVGYNDELKKTIRDDRYNNINDGLIFSSLLPLRVNQP